MATCRECLHQELCDTYSRMGVTDVPSDDITICELFKSKSDYVKRERGEWIKQGKDWDCKCSICGGESFYHLDSTPSNFCPNCGADMRKENNIRKMEGFLGFVNSKGEFPIKTAPKWCPLKRKSEVAE